MLPTDTGDVRNTVLRPERSLRQQQKVLPEEFCMWECLLRRALQMRRREQQSLLQLRQRGMRQDLLQTGSAVHQRQVLCLSVRERMLQLGSVMPGPEIEHVCVVKLQGAPRDLRFAGGTEQ